MKKRWLLPVASVMIPAQIAVILAACASDEETGGVPREQTYYPPADAAPAPSPDGSDATDAEVPCVEGDCVYYPTECTEGALCLDALFAASDGLDLRTYVTSISGRSPSDIWLSGTVGTVAHFDGTAWRRSIVDTQQSLSVIWLHGDSEIAFGDPKRLYTRGLDAGVDAEASADGWSFLDTTKVPPQWGGGFMRLETSFAYPGADSLWIGVSSQTDSGGLWRMRWSVENNRFQVVGTTLRKCTYVPCREVSGLHGASADEIWAVGPRGAAFRVTNAESDAPTLTTFNTLTRDALDGVWAAASDDVWAVGALGTVRRYRGDARFWEVYDAVPTKQHLHAVAGSSPNDIWIAGDEGTVFHFDGATWTRVKVAGLGARRPRLDHIWVPSPGKVWIAGQGVLVSLGGKP
ncbi:hypothetical protein AKJ09_02304 [Labilithrix luteola]|uniref:Type IV fimbrial biogenesis protein PilY1 n=1 Tax=Labilithrix luteola TaxID=1391654 RepID=A0A0K1PQ19_9BACT|nr:hypothetical protein [Labilithrix luteola]AKU95640.1 hypothetical protein AKJ09_02304 [Labilithrix luteola]